MKKSFSSSIFLGRIVLLICPAWADFQAGEDAYLNGDYATALEAWRPLAVQGDPAAQNMLGLMYRYGQGVPQDYETARLWYRRSADQGYAMAQNNLGMLYRLGLGGPQDFQEAFRWFLRAAEQGDAGAQNHVGLMYYRGEGVEQNYVQAYMWATLAAQQGLDQAIQALTMLEKDMTPEQIAEGRGLADAWKPKGKESVL